MLVWLGKVVDESIDAIGNTWCFAKTKGEGLEMVIKIYI